MYFGDEKRIIKQVNNADKPIIKREDFLKELKSGKVKEREKEEKEKAIFMLTSKLETRIVDFKEKIVKRKEFSEKSSLFQRIIFIIQSKKDISSEKIEKLIFLSLEKLGYESLKRMLRSHSIGIIREGHEFLFDFLNLISNLNEKSYKNMSIDWDSIIESIIISLFICIYQEIYIKKSVINEFSLISKGFIILNSINISEDMRKVLFFKLASNKSFAYLLSKIVLSFEKIIHIALKEVILKYLIEISILNNERGVVNEHIKVKRSLKTYDNSLYIMYKHLLDEFIKNIKYFSYKKSDEKRLYNILNEKKEVDEKDKDSYFLSIGLYSIILNIINTGKYICEDKVGKKREKEEISFENNLKEYKSTIVNSLSLLDKDNLVNLFNNSSFYILNYKEKFKNDYLNIVLYDNILIFYTIIMNKLSKSENTCLVSNQKQAFLQKIFFIFNKIFSSFVENDVFSVETQEKDFVSNQILFVNACYSLCKSIYSYDNVNSYSILDYFFNKSNTQININKVIDRFILYSAKYLINEVSSRGKEGSEFIEVIAFVLDQKIQYNKKVVLINNKTIVKNMYDNLPFNILYLKSISKLILKQYIIKELSETIGENSFSEKYSNEKSQSNQNILKNNSISQSNILQHCLQSLYSLDSEVEFSSFDTFWQEGELQMKLIQLDSVSQMEIISKLPFLYNLKLRINSFYKNMKTIPNKILLITSSSSNNYHENRIYQLQIPRYSIFDTVFDLYINGELDHQFPWKITFINKFNQIEDGQDAGGLYNEFLYKLSESAFSTESNFFQETHNGFLSPNINSFQISDLHLRIYEFLGYIVGLSIVNEVIIFPNFSNFFLNNVLDIENSFIELKSFDYELYSNLINLIEYDGNIENDFGLNFTIINRQPNGKVIETELIPNGKNIMVNNGNRLLYVRQVSKYKLESQFLQQSNAFKRGLQRIFPEESYKVFTSNELRQIIAGFDKEINVIEWKANTKYENFNRKDLSQVKAIEDFWEIVSQMENKDKEKLLFFVTSLKRPPLTGFKSLLPNFSISITEKTFPSASTCINQLKIPVLSKDELRKVIYYVINSDSGFYYV